MRLIFINRFFHPDEAATAIMLGELVFGLGEAFPQRHVITSRGHYSGGDRRLRSRETMNGVAVHRVAALVPGNRSLAGRVLSFAGFYLAGFAAVLRIARRGDLVICMTDPPFGSIAMAPAARLRGARLVNWPQDIYPETANRLGYGSERGVASRLLQRLRDRNWRRAEANVVIGERMGAFLARRGVEPDRIHVIPNWTDERRLSPIAAPDNPLRREWGFAESDCVIGYSGNLGRAHDIDTMLGAIELCAGDRQSHLRFLFIGGGAKLAQLRGRAARPGAQLPIDFRDYQPRERLRESLCVPDVHWLSLDPALEGLIVPSKFYSAAAVGRPILFVGDPKGEIALLIEQGECGRVFAPGRSADLADYLRELAANRELRRELGRKAREFSEQQLSRDARLAEWRDLLRSLAQARAGSPEPN